MKNLNRLLRRRREEDDLLMRCSKKIKKAPFARKENLLSGQWPKPGENPCSLSEGGPSFADKLKGTGNEEGCIENKGKAGEEILSDNSFSEDSMHDSDNDYDGGGWGCKITESHQSYRSLPMKEERMVRSQDAQKGAEVSSEAIGRGLEPEAQLVEERSIMQEQASIMSRHLVKMIEFNPMVDLKPQRQDRFKAFLWPCETVFIPTIFRGCLTKDENVQQRTRKVEKRARELSEQDVGCGMLMITMGEGLDLVPNQENDNYRNNVAIDSLPHDLGPILKEMGLTA
ncbi:hypothetical protein K1719_018040 [Acacia pycnantha]|nr:hypothetical protein K1719_018040 [Acacia pycnantha]